MYKVLIIEDEPLVRLGIGSMVDWEAFGYQLLPLASNGEEGLEWIRKYEPDLVITDIKMPRLDGVSVIRACKEEGRKARFIVLSSYNDFPLVKEVMKLGVIDYLMKVNITPGQIEALLQEIHTLLETQNLSKEEKEEKEQTLLLKEEQQRAIQKGWMRELLFGTIDFSKAKKEIEELSSKQEQKPYYVVAILLGRQQGTLQEKGKNVIDEVYIPYFMNLCKEVLGEFARGEIFFQSEELFMLYTEANKEDLIALSKRIHYLLKQYFNVEGVLGASKRYKSFLDLHEAYKQSKEVVLKVLAIDKEIPLYFYAKEQLIHKEEGALDLAKIKVKKAKKYMQEKVYEKNKSLRCRCFFRYYAELLEHDL